MTPHPPYAPPPPAVRLRMQAVRRVNTKPELALRSALHALGLRFRVDFPVLPDRRRRVDIVFTRALVACFVHGCFWHKCRWHKSAPKTNAAYWSHKIETNVVRDRNTSAQLRRRGWRVVTCWSHEDPAAAAKRIEKIVRNRRRA